MKLISCHIENFGQLQNKDYAFNDNLTCIYENNGAGKTTLAAFIKAMFYGLESTKKTDKNFGDRLHYYPFSNGKFGGYLILNAFDKEYRIERYFDKTSFTKDTLKIFNQETHEEETSITDVGEFFFGIDKEAFERTKVARDYILDNIMLPVINEPRKEVSKYAPKIMMANISVDKIKDVIGPGGKMINKIIDETGVKIDINDDGKVCVYANDSESGKKAMDMILDIAKIIEVGGIYDGKVTKIMPFGAFINIGGGNEGLLHISKISSKRVEKVEDVLSVGDEVTVKVSEIDNQGRINLNMKDLEASSNNEEHKENE